MESTSFRYGGINKFGTNEVAMMLLWNSFESRNFISEKPEVPIMSIRKCPLCDKLKFKVTYAGWEGEMRAIKFQACADL